MAARTRKAWRPRVAGGDFFIDDRHYYLYAEKQTYTIEECTVSSFTLGKYPLSLASVTVTIEGFSFTSFTVEGKTLLIKHPDSLVWMELHGAAWDDTRKGRIIAGYTFEPDSVVAVAYQYEYESSPGVLAVGNANETFYVRDAVRSFAVPGNGEDLEPVVVTDDNIQPGNKRDFVPEFKLGSLLFNAADNILFNPGFCVIPVSGVMKAVGWTRIEEEEAAGNGFPAM